MTLLTLLAVAALATARPGHEPIGTVKGDDPNKPFRIDPVGLRLTVDAQGKPGAITCLPRTSPPLCPILTKAVSQWGFAPGRRHSQPAVVDIVMTLDLAAVPKPGGYGVQVLDAKLALAGVMPASADTPLAPPVYPPEDMKRNREGKVTFEVEPDAAIGHYRILRTWFDGEPVTGRNTLVAAATKAITSWPLATLAPEQKTICQTIEFSLGGKRSVESPASPGPCTPTYAEGFAMPVLLTDVVKAPL